MPEHYASTVWIGRPEGVLKPMILHCPEPELLMHATVLWRRKNHPADPVPKPTLRPVDAARGKAQPDEKYPHIKGK